MLTAEEKTEFTSLNFLAHTLLRMKGKATDTIHPCWLCMNEEAKEEARQDAIQHISVLACLTLNVEQAERHAERAIGHELNHWIEAETKFKKLRDEGNPNAFFAPVPVD